MTSVWKSLYQYSRQDVDLLSALVRQRIGLHYPDEKEDLLLERVFPLMAEHGLDALRDYYYFLKYDPQSEEEWERLAHVLTVNETYFWREFRQIRAVAAEIVPQFQRAAPGKQVRIWHAACASGEEAYTMAIALLERARFLYGEIDILGTDIDRQALAQAEAGVYGERSFRSIPTEILERYFISENGLRQTYRITDVVRRRVRFRRHNLLDDEQIRTLGLFDVIFCRNVWIYFSEDVARKVAESLYGALRPGGYLCVGASESLLRYPQWFEPVEQSGAFMYRKIPAAVQPR